MSRSTLAVVVALSAVSACDRSSPQQTPVSSPVAAAVPAPDASFIDPSRVESCAGFDAERAAAMLGVPAGALTAKSGWSKEMGGQTCRYWSADSLIGPGIQFFLDAKPSAAAAAAEITSLRDNAPAGDAAIRSAMGQGESERPLIEFDGVGDEAIWDALTSRTTLRVGNVVAAIEASASRELTPGKQRADIDLERRVAVEITRGLRSREQGGSP